MVKKKHREYSLEDLRENKDTAIGANRMVDPHVNPKAEDFDYDLKHGINQRQQTGKKRWTVSAYNYEEPEKSRTPRLTVSELKQTIKEALSKNFADAREADIKLMAALKKKWELVEKYWNSSKIKRIAPVTTEFLESANVGDWFFFKGSAVRIFAKKTGKLVFGGMAPHGYPLNHPKNWKIMTPQQIENENGTHGELMKGYVDNTPNKMD